jgi:hypothetical protein
MNTNRCFLLLFVLFFGFISAFAQDTIVKRNNQVIVCKVKEIASDEIKYLLPDHGDILIGIDKNEVEKIVLSTGMVMHFSHSLKGKENYEDQNKNAVKFRLLSPLYGYSDFTYERSLKPGASMEASVGFIGLGFRDNDRYLMGLSVRGGYKFIKSPDFYLKGLRYAHVLKGMYFKPEIAFSYYEKETTGFNFFSEPEKREYFAAAILFNIGNQWIMDDIIAIDLYMGFGYGYSSDNTFRIRYGFSTGGNRYPVAFSSGFRIGILL